MQPTDLPLRWQQKLKPHLTHPSGRLGAADFPKHIVRLDFEDGSFAEFHYAFVIDAPELNEICVLTEHCGYHIFRRGAAEVSGPISSS